MRLLTRAIPLLRVLLFSAVAVLPFSQCQQNNGDPTPLEQLPAVTQTGANTFGCLVNGQPWTPLGNNSTSNYTVYYDPTYRKGTLNLSVYRYIGKGANDFQTITLFSDSLLSVGVYPLTIPRHQEALFSDLTTHCAFHSGEAHFRRGALTITRLDLQTGIISGTFSFTLYKSGCDSIRITNGRFDKRL